MIDSGAAQVGGPLRAIHWRRFMPGDVLLHDVVQAVAVPHLVDLHDVGVDQRGGRLRLALETLQIDVVVGQGRLEDLHRHPPLQPALLGQVDLGHGPAAQPPQQPQIAQLPAGKIGSRGGVGGLGAGITHRARNALRGGRVWGVRLECHLSLPVPWVVENSRTN